MKGCLPKLLKIKTESFPDKLKIKMESFPERLKIAKQVYCMYQHFGRERNKTDISRDRQSGCCELKYPFFQHRRRWLCVCCISCNRAPLFQASKKSFFHASLVTKKMIYEQNMAQGLQFHLMHFEIHFWQDFMTV